MKMFGSVKQSTEDFSCTVKESDNIVLMSSNSDSLFASSLGSSVLGEVEQEVLHDVLRGMGLVVFYWRNYNGMNMKF